MEMNCGLCDPGPWGNHSRVAAHCAEKIALKCGDDDYDRLIQLCDSLAGAEGVLEIEERMTDVKRRYGSFPKEKWNCNLALKKYFEDKMGKMYML